MGLLDGYFDPQQFGEGGVLLGRLLALQQMQGQYQPGVSVDPQPSAFGQVPSTPQAPASVPPQLAVPALGATLTGPPFAALANGVADPSMGQPIDRTVMGQQTLQQRIDPSDNPQEDQNSQYRALRPIIGDHNAMLAIVHPEVGRRLIARTQAGEANELSDIRDREQRDTVSSDDYLSGIREGNVRRNQDGSLDVTNGTVVTLSLKNGRAKTVTVTNADVAHIDGTTGEIVIQKSPLGKGI